LVKIQGTPIIERLARLFASQGADSISIIINTQQPGTLLLLKELQKELPIEIIVKDTPSSMHSLHTMSHLLRGDRFCLTTVDTLFHEDEFAAYIKAFNESDGDGVMAVTDYIDDEKPLYIDTDSDMGIIAFRDTAGSGTRYISGGIYGLTPQALDILDECMASGMERMRNFQRRLVEGGMRLKAHPFTKIIDIDHAEDIAKAEKFLSER
jgi:NDP-sugar pyrophosphorylase family protein